MVEDLLKFTLHGVTMVSHVKCEDVRFFLTLFLISLYEELSFDVIEVKGRVGEHDVMN